MPAIPPLSLSAIDRRERRFDGPPLPDDPAGPSLAVAARARLFQRLADERRREIARERLGVEGKKVAEAAALGRGVRTLRFYRDQGVAWAGIERRGEKTPRRCNPID